MKFTRRSLGSKIVLLAAAAQLLAAGFGVSALLTPSAAGAAQSVPYKVNFQGRLTDNSGNAMPDGLYNIKFRLFTALTAGSNVWEEDRIFTGVDNRIQLTSGLFNIQFGDLTALSPALFSSGTYPLYLEVELPTPATSTCATNACAVFTEGAMTPRQPLAASPYAISADTLDGLDSTAFGQLSANNTFTGANTFTPVAGVGITVKAVAATHSLDVKDASNVTQAFFDASGILNVAQTIQATVATVDIGTTGTPFRSGYFSTSVQTPALNASASGGTITTNLGTLQRVSPGTTTIDLKDPANTTLAVTNSGTGLASLSVEGGVAVGTGQLFSVGPTNGVTVSACSTSQYLASAAATGGLVTGGTCTSNDLQTVYNNSTSPASIGLTDGKNFVLNALDTTTDPSVLVNLQCVTCSASGGRFAVQHAGTDVFTVNPIGSLVVAPPAGQAVTFNLPGSSSAAFSSTSAPTTDLVSINNTGQPVATAGVNGLNITYIGGVGVIEASGARIDTTPGSTSGSTWNGLRLVSTTGPSAGVAFNGIKLEGPAAAAGGTATGLNITTGWDVGLNIQSGGIRMSAMTDPATPAIDTLAVYARTISGRTMLKSEGSSGVSYALQPSLFQQNIWIGQAGSANNTAQWQSQGARVRRRSVIMPPSQPLRPPTPQTVLCSRRVRISVALLTMAAPVFLLHHEWLFLGHSPTIQALV
jgi:hypothetical protein